MRFKMEIRKISFRRTAKKLQATGGVKNLHSLNFLNLHRKYNTRYQDRKFHKT